MGLLVYRSLSAGISIEAEVLMCQVLVKWWRYNLYVHPPHENKRHGAAKTNNDGGALSGGKINAGGRTI